MCITAYPALPMITHIGMGLVLVSLASQSGVCFPSSFVIILLMKALIETNPYLKDPITRKKLIRRSVETSCGVEGIVVRSSRRIEIPRHRTQKLYSEMVKQLSK